MDGSFLFGFGVFDFPPAVFSEFYSIFVPGWVDDAALGDWGGCPEFHGEVSSFDDDGFECEFVAVGLFGALFSVEVVCVDFFVCG